MSNSNAARIIETLLPSRRSKPVSRREKRANQRKLSNEVTVHLIDDDGSLIPIDSFDLSSGGIYLHSELLLYPGDEVVMQVKLPNYNNPLLILGDVIRVELDEGEKTPGMGVSFWSLTSSERTILSDYLYQ